MKELIQIFQTGVTDSAGETKSIELQMNKDASKLYINGKEILTKEVISLRWLELILLSMTALGAFSSGVIGVIAYIHPLLKCMN